MLRRLGEAKRGEREEREKERGAEEELDKEVKKDVTGWTVVTRSKKQRKRTIQIFVKVDGSKVTAMEVILTDKVEDVKTDSERQGRVRDDARENIEEKRKAEQLRSQ